MKKAVKVNTVPDIKDKPEGMKRYQFFRSLGYCGRCGKNPSTTTLCDECRSYHKAWAVQNKAKASKVEKKISTKPIKKQPVKVKAPKQVELVEIKSGKVHKGTIAQMVEDIEAK